MRDVNRSQVKAILKFDFNNDGIVDELDAGPISGKACNKNGDGEDCVHFDGFVQDPFLRTKDGGRLPFERAPKECNGRKEFGTYAFTQYDPRVRFFNPDRLRSFVPQQHVAIVDDAGAVSKTMVLSGLIVGIKMVGSGSFEPVRDDAGNTLLRAYYEDHRGKIRQCKLSELVWVTSQEERIDPRLLTHDTSAPPRTLSEIMLRPLFQSVQQYVERYGIPKTDHEKQVARDFLEKKILDWRSVGKGLDPKRSDAIYLDKPLWEGIETALGHLIGFTPAEVLNRHP